MEKIVFRQGCTYEEGDIVTVSRDKNFEIVLSTGVSDLKQED